MFSDIKSEGKQILRSNYKTLLLWQVIYFLVTMVPLGVLQTQKLPQLVLQCVFDFFCAPIFLALIYKNCTRVMRNVPEGADTSYAFLKSPKKLLNLCVIGLAQGLVDAVRAIYVFYNPAVDAINPTLKNPDIMPLLFSILNLVVGVLLAGSIYYFATHECGALTAMKASFRAMKSRFWNYILFQLSFLGWIILSYVIVMPIALFTALFCSADTVVFATLVTILFGGAVVFLAPYINVCTAVYFQKAFAEK